MTKQEAEQKMEEYKILIGEFWCNKTSGIESKIVGVLIEENVVANDYKVMIVCKNKLGEFPNESTLFFAQNHRCTNDYQA